MRPHRSTVAELRVPVVPRLLERELGARPAAPHSCLLTYDVSVRHQCAVGPAPVAWLRPPLRHYSPPQQPVRELLQSPGKLGEIAQERVPVNPRVGSLTLLQRPSLAPWPQLPPTQVPVGKNLGAAAPLTQTLPVPGSRGYVGCTG